MRREGPSEQYHANLRHGIARFVKRLRNTSPDSSYVVTTAYNALRLGRRVITMELNVQAWGEHIVGDKESEAGTKLTTVKRGHGLKDLKKVEVIKPRRQGTKFAREEKRRIYEDYLKFRQQRIPKATIYQVLCDHYERGEFSIRKVIKSSKKASATITDAGTLVWTMGHWRKKR